MNWLTILNYELGETYIYSYTNEDLLFYNDSIEEYIEKYLDFKLSNCAYMCTNNLILKINE